MTRDANSGSDDRWRETGDLAAVAAEFHARGWCLATSGNFSVVLEDAPLRLLITQTGRDKRRLVDGDFMVIDAAGAPLDPPSARPSAEALLHCAIAGATGARAVLHTHSVANTLVGEHYLPAGTVRLTGYEMLKGIAGIDSHAAELRLPVLPNSQDMSAFSGDVRRMLEADSDVRGFLIAGHGLYTWGASLGDARRHIEVLEFLLDCVARRTRFRSYDG